MTDTIKNLVKEINVLTRSALEGKLDIRGNEQDFKGAYQDIVHGVNKTLDAGDGSDQRGLNGPGPGSNKDMTARVKGDLRAITPRSKSLLIWRGESGQGAAAGGDWRGAGASASVQVSTGGQSLSQGASEQASSLEEVSSSLQEMSSMTKQNALNAREAKGVAEQARGSATREWRA